MPNSTKFTSAALTEEQIASYERDGYLQLDGVLSGQELDELRASVDQVMAPHIDAQRRCDESEDFDKFFVMRSNLWRTHAGVRRYVFDTALADIARQLCRTERVRLWHDGALIKLNGGGRPAPWHRDFPFWSMNEPVAVSCWMALDDVDADNGCMHFIPGSHCWDWLVPTDTGDLLRALRAMPRSQSARPPVIVNMKAGSCTFHHCLLYHHSLPNTSSLARRAIKTVYMPEGTTYRYNCHCAADLRGFKEGQELGGVDFPVLSGHEAGDESVARVVRPQSAEGLPSELTLT
jgi:ectoine hydroxylase-related dioxygenase (phytanoyl-CoA dioxygenase family)